MEKAKKGDGIFTLVTGVRKEYRAELTVLITFAASPALEDISLASLSMSGSGWLISVIRRVMAAGSGGISTSFNITAKSPVATAAWRRIFVKKPISVSTFLVLPLPHIHAVR